MPKQLLGKRNISSSTCVAPEVDAELANSTSYEVYKDASGKYYNCYLMNSNCDKNNNKYYII